MSILKDDNEIVSYTIVEDLNVNKQYASDKFDLFDKYDWVVRLDNEAVKDVYIKYSSVRILDEQLHYSFRVSDSKNVKVDNNYQAISDFSHIAHKVLENIYNDWRVNNDNSKV